MEEKKTIYSEFDIRLGNIFHHLYGSTDALLKDQLYWDEIQELKQLARNEVMLHHNTLGDIII